MLNVPAAMATVLVPGYCFIMKNVDEDALYTGSSAALQRAVLTG